MATDIFRDDGLGYYLYYNGNKLFYSNSTDFTGFDEAFYYAEKTPRSESLTKFTYNELCLNLDFNYGLKQLHGISDFDSYFAAVGLKKRLLDRDPVEFDKAVKELCYAYLSDGHTEFCGSSAYVGIDNKNQIVNPENLFFADDVYYEHASLYKNARAKAYGADSDHPSGIVPGLEFSEDGKTAVVRFDSFTDSESRNIEKRIDSIFTNSEKTRENLKYIIKTDINSEDFAKYITTDVFIVLVNEVINEKGTVENVVLDMSCNSGGTVPAAVLTLAWMLGKAQINFTDSITNAKTSVVYNCDLDEDGVFGEANEDCLVEKKLFCLISPASFSCGNMVPAVLKAANRCTVLGATSGGGTAVTYPTCAADTTEFQISSRWIMSLNKNGSNYDIDRGVEPHERLLPNQMYDIDVLTKIINKKLNP